MNKKKTKMKYYFTADFHIGHANIIRYCKRPFKDVNEMREKIIRNWNTIVKDEDIVFHIGDFVSSYEKVNIENIINRLNGQIIFIKGNHDRGPLFKIQDAMFILGQQQLHLVHIPEEAQADYNLVGHVHEKWKTKKVGDHFCINVGVDQWNFTPVSIKQISRIINENETNEKI